MASARADSSGAAANAADIKTGDGQHFLTIPYKVPKDLNELKFSVKVDTPLDADNIYYANWVSDNSDGGFYTGLQPHPNGQAGVRFSYFGAGATPIGDTCASGADDTSGVTCGLDDVKYTKGATYTFDAKKISSDGGSTYEGSVTNEATGETRKIGAWKLPADVTWRGDGETFIEKYGAVGDCSKLPDVNATYSGAAANGSPMEFQGESVKATNVPGEGIGTCGNVSSYIVTPSQGGFSIASHVGTTLPDAPAPGSSDAPPAAPAADGSGGKPAPAASDAPPAAPAADGADGSDGQPAADGSSGGSDGSGGQPGADGSGSGGGDSGMPAADPASAGGDSASDGSVGSAADPAAVPAAVPGSDGSGGSAADPAAVPAADPGSAGSSGDNGAAGSASDCPPAADGPSAGADPSADPSVMSSPDPAAADPAATDGSAGAADPAAADPAAADPTATDGSAGAADPAAADPAAADPAAADPAATDGSAGSADPVAADPAATDGSADVPAADGSSDVPAAGAAGTTAMPTVSDAQLRAIVARFIAELNAAMFPGADSTMAGAFGGMDQMPAADWTSMSGS